MKLLRSILFYLLGWSSMKLYVISSIFYTELFAGFSLVETVYSLTT